MQQCGIYEDTSQNTRMQDLLYDGSRTFSEDLAKSKQPHETAASGLFPTQLAHWQMSDLGKRWRREASAWTPAMSFGCKRCGVT